MRNIIALTLFLFLSSNSYAQFSDGSISVRGIGQSNCGEFMMWSETGNKFQTDIINQWIWGYLVGYQMRGAFNKTYSIPSSGNITSPTAETIQLYLRKYCSNNPLSSIHNGVLSMIKELGGNIAGK